MSCTGLEESVKKFQYFINQHPDLIIYIRKNGYSWQDYYEKWMILGEDDPYWDSFKRSKASHSKEDEQQFSFGQYRHLYDQFVKLTEHIDVEKMQKHVKELNQTIQVVDNLLKQFVKNRHKLSKDSETIQWFKD